MKTHTELVNHFYYNKKVLEDALGLSYVWIRDREYLINRNTNERADLVFQDMFDPYKALKEATCYVLEIKKEKGDHEILGQLMKYIEVVEKIGKSTGHWGTVKGMAAAHDYTESGVRLLWKAKFKTFLIRELDGGSIYLKEIKMKRKASVMLQAF